MLQKEHYSQDLGSRGKQACIACRDTTGTLGILKEILILSIFGLCPPSPISLYLLFRQIFSSPVPQVTFTDLLIFCVVPRDKCKISGFRVEKSVPGYNLMLIINLTPDSFWGSLRHLLSYLSSGF